VGLALEDLMGWKWTVAIHPDDVEGIVNRWRHSLASGEPFLYEARVRRADGKYRWMLHSKVAARDEAGDIFKWYGSSIDIEERRAAEDKIRQGEAELRQMLDLTPQCLGVLGADGSHIYANRASLDYLGMTQDEWKQSGSIDALVHPDDKERFVRASSTSSVYELEVRVRNGEGGFRWFLSRFSPLLDEKGQITRWYIASSDIEDRKRAEERLEEENAALREEIVQTSMFEEIVGTSSALKRVLSHIFKVAPTNSTVLITGETGTGKELVARAIHRRSDRASRAFSLETLRVEKLDLARLQMEAFMTR
jgi:PAS domain S-box-containing protein